MAALAASIGRRLLRSGQTYRKRCFSAGAYHIGNGPSYMRGAVFWEPNKPLTFEDFHMPRPKAGEVLVRTKACGVCHSDLHVMKGEIPFVSPCVMGHEITGEVVEHRALTDPRIISRLPLGSQVVGAFIMPCGNCFYCIKVKKISVSLSLHITEQKERSTMVKPAFFFEIVEDLFTC